ncbi:MAG: aldehyde dehydrogenase family protein [Nitrospirae bacterium]|nr:aldehyde dehydrogenase family protein [Candidatus Troglogloeales bacterium]
MQECKIFISGQWRATSERLSVLNPYNNEPIGYTYLASEENIEEAICSATEAFKEMRTVPSYKRAEALQKIADGLKEKREEIARMITLESAKPITDARVEVARAVNTFTIASEEAKRIGGEFIPLDLMSGSEGRQGLTRRVPIGPIVGISPFNFPLNLVAHKVAPAIAAGNTIILKPAPKTPLTALMLAEIIASTDLPTGAVQVFSTTNMLAEKMVIDPRIKMLTFTGSAAVGWSLKEKCNKKRVLLELGGNAGVMIHSDADLAYAARRCVAGSFSYAGQVCISVQRIYIQAACYQSFLDRFLPQVESLIVGNPIDEKTNIPPMINLDAAKRVAAWIDEAVASGAKVLAGGQWVGSVMIPTVLANTTPAMKVNCEEIFGPVVTVSPYEHLNEAIAAVNQSPYGLQAGIFTRDIQAVFEAFEQTEVGGLIVNDVPTYRVDHMPYGGMKESGVGREGISYAIREMTELKLLALNLQSLSRC